MTTKEQQTVDQLCKIITDQRASFQEFKPNRDSWLSYSKPFSELEESSPAL